MRKLLDVHLQRNTVLEAHRHRCPKGVHQAADSASFLRHRDEQFTRSAVVVEADGDVALMATHVELVGHAAAGVGEPLPPRCRGHLRRGLVGFRTGVERLALLRTIAVDRQGLEPHPPALHVRSGNIGRRRFSWHVDRL